MTTHNGPILALGIVIIGIMVAGFLPTLIDDPRQDRDLTLTQDNNTEIIVYNQLNASVDEVTATNATITLENVDTGNTTTVIVPDGSFNETELSGDTLNVSVSRVLADTEADVTYTYPPTFGWEGGTNFIVDNLGITLIGLLSFAVFLLIMKAV